MKNHISAIFTRALRNVICASFFLYSGALKTDTSFFYKCRKWSFFFSKILKKQMKRKFYFFFLNLLNTCSNIFRKNFIQFHSMQNIGCKKKIQDSPKQPFFLLINKNQPILSDYFLWKDYIEKRLKEKKPIIFQCFQIGYT